MQRLALIAAPIVLVAGVGVGVWLVLGDREDSRASCAALIADLRPFEDTRRGLAGDTPTLRQKLADRMIDCRYLEGRTRARVRALLGRPEEANGGYWDWTIGDERASMFVIDSESLVVHFARSGRVDRVEIVQN
jgi:hypothetical protein